MSSRPESVVLDTNVIVSGFVSKGPPAAVLGLFEQHLVEHCTSLTILEELTRVLHYPRIAKLLHRAKLDASVITRWLIAHSRLVTTAPLPDHPIPADHDDEKFLACALAAEASVIVSGDRHLLQLGVYRAVRILSARSFMERWS